MPEPADSGSPWSPRKDLSVPEEIAEIRDHVTEARVDISWLKRFQWLQLGLVVGQIALTAAVATHLLGGPGPAQAAEAVIRVFT